MLKRTPWYDNDNYGALLYHSSAWTYLLTKFAYFPIIWSNILWYIFFYFHLQSFNKANLTWGRIIPRYSQNKQLAAKLVYSFLHVRWCVCRSITPGNVLTFHQQFNLILFTFEKPKSSKSSCKKKAINLYNILLNNIRDQIWSNFLNHTILDKC